MTPQRKNALDIKGFKIRTRIASEITINNGKLQSLWDSFHRNIGSQLEEDYQYYGVFFNNDPEQFDCLDILAGVPSHQFEKNGVDVNDEVAQVTLVEGDYLIFSAVGAIPQATLCTWQQVRQYFNEQDCPYQRAYLTDYEHYISPGLTKIYISIKNK